MTTHAPTQITTPSGRWLSLVKPAPETIHFPDIAEMLAKHNRFAGSTANVTYSVAQHSCLVSDHLPPDARLAGLLHDAHEAALGDWITPLKNAISLTGGTAALNALDQIETAMAAAIHRAADHTWPIAPPLKHVIRIADMQALSTEIRDLISPGAARSPNWQKLPDPWPQIIKPWPWPKAAEEWLKRLHTCTRLQSGTGVQI